MTCSMLHGRSYRDTKIPPRFRGLQDPQQQVPSYERQKWHEASSGEPLPAKIDARANVAVCTCTRSLFVIENSIVTPEYTKFHAIC